MTLFLTLTSIALGQNLTLETPPALVIGAPGTLTVSGLNAYETVHLVRGGAVGPGPCPALIGGQCLDVQVGLREIGQGVADANGVAVVHDALGVNVNPGSWAIQAVAIRGAGGVDTVLSQAELVPVVQPNATIEGWCGWDDGWATRLVITTTGPVTCDNAEDGPYMQFEDWTGVIESDGALWDDTNPNATASHCDGPGYWGCQPATGTLGVDDWDLVDPVIGSYDLDADDGTHQSGDFYALWCPQVVVCG